MGILYLIPGLLSEESYSGLIPGAVQQFISQLRFFIVEEERSARRFLRKIDPHFPIDDTHFLVFNEHSNKTEIGQYMEPLSHSNVGLMSEAGLPCVADPGHEIVLAAHRRGIHVVPLPGMSSIFMALMASGLNGQNFAFHGYLPVKKEEKIKKIRQLAAQPLHECQTHIVMDAPYRNNAMLADLLEALPAHAQLCIAAGITSPAEFIKTATVMEWQQQKPDLNKIPAIFIFRVHP